MKWKLSYTTRGPCDPIQHLEKLSKLFQRMPWESTSFIFYPLGVNTLSNFRTITWGALPGAASAQRRNRPRNWECLIGCCGKLHFPRKAAAVTPNPHIVLTMYTPPIERWGLCSNLNLGGLRTTGKESPCNLQSQGINTTELLVLLEGSLLRLRHHAAWKPTSHREVLCPQPNLCFQPSAPNSQHVAPNHVSLWPSGISAPCSWILPELGVCPADTPNAMGQRQAAPVCPVQVHGPQNPWA